MKHESATLTVTVKDGSNAKIEIESLQPATSKSAWACRLVLNFNAQCLAVYLTNEEAVEIGTALFKAVAQI